ncbi:hypothetical protein E4L96_11555 [Massilia arenosa]|uniref:Uncharacterized protein n=1 Tax=Zemynaea arenosa TaxID=2561931 RepID=A0A4Y9SFF4_9BURK|nr:hypothetical protein [Massilia arenosa]TFW19630.1 hypothetical protein E4L96_11555 [Massilia arenosa]
MQRSALLALTLALAAPRRLGQDTVCAPARYDARMKSQWTCLVFAAVGFASHAAELHGALDLRASASTRGGIRDGGLGKLRSGGSTLGSGQAVLAADSDLSDNLSAQVELSADSDHAGVLDIRSAVLTWSPLPSDAWKTRVRAGFFFPPSSVEIAYGAPGWLPARTISSAAVNSWIGEEIRTQGIEWSTRRLGRFAGSAYDVGLVAAVFNHNDPAGTLLAWRGWSISDRIAGRNEARRLPDLPVYRPDGPIPRQSGLLRPFREIDGRLGYYVGAELVLPERAQLAALHYDNRADALAVQDGQYGWHTRFDLATLTLQPGRGWTVLAQALHGDTLMGARAVALDFEAVYVLVSHRLGAGTASARYDRFQTREHDLLPADPNNETGHGLAVAWALPLTDQWSWLSEALFINSTRAARRLVGQPARLSEHSVTTALRFEF